MEPNFAELEKLLNSEQGRQIVKDFHLLYYYSYFSGKTWANTFWMGVPTLKCPLDCWIYQEIIFELKPDTIIETGTASGGSALFLANICDLINKGRVISIDIESRENRPRHERIKYLSGSSTSEPIIKEVRSLIAGQEKILVILDSDHSRNHVLNELKLYSQFVSPGSYLIVEDSNVNGHPVLPKFGPGPQEAIEEFLIDNDNFAVDQSKEKFYLTFNPRGFLKRIK